MKKKVVFEVDDSALFDALGHMDGDMSFLGRRLVETILSGSTSLVTQLGLSAYGVTSVEITPIPEDTKDDN